MLSFLAPLEVCFFLQCLLPEVWIWGSSKCGWTKGTGSLRLLFLHSLPVPLTLLHPPLNITILLPISTHHALLFSFHLPSLFLKFTIFPFPISHCLPVHLCTHTATASSCTYTLALSLRSIQTPHFLSPTSSCSTFKSICHFSAHLDAHRTCQFHLGLTNTGQKGR